MVVEYSELLKVRLKQYEDKLEEAYQILAKESDEADELALEYLEKVEELRAKNDYIVENIPKIKAEIEKAKKELEEELNKKKKKNE